MSGAIPFLRRALPATAAALTLAACATTKAPAPKGATAGPAGGPPPPSAAGRPAPGAEATGGALFRVGLKSDLSSFALEAPGAPWSLVASGSAATLRGPLTFWPEGSAARRFAVQAGAYSQEGTARTAADRLSQEQGVAGAVAFSADRGVYRVLLGDFATRAEAAALVEKLKVAGQDALLFEETTPTRPAFVQVSDEAGVSTRFVSPVDVFPAAAGMRLSVDGTTYRGSLRVLVNSRGMLNVVNRVDLEEYLYGVVPAEMGPRRFDEVEALKAQAVAARTYALAHRGQFESEGYDLCATPKCQVYAGLAAEDPLSSAAVDGTRGLVLAFEGRFADALFVSTCGGRTENVENVFGEQPVPYLVSVDCGELVTTRIEGARLPRGAAPRTRTALEWRGYVLKAHAPRGKAVRAAALATAQEWAGVEKRGAPPSGLEPALVYPSLLAAFGLEPALREHLVATDVAYVAEQPSASARLSGSAREAYDFFLRFRFAGDQLPPAEHRLEEEEYAGLLFSAALRLSGVTESSGRFLSREGANLWVKTAEGRVGLPADPEIPLARRVGDSYLASGSLELRAGDRLRWWKRGSRVLALWVELDAAGPSFERESAWTEWVRRVPAGELARRMGGRVAGKEVREVTVTRRSPSGRATELKVSTDTSQVTLQRFDLRQALGLPEMLFTVQRVRGPQGEAEFLFLGRGWGHGVGLCQNGAFGMALAGFSFDQILRHYYTGIEIVAASSVAPGPPSTR